MKFQLVVQLSASSLRNFDELIDLEDLLIAKLNKQNLVDGHDLGSGEANIFIFTNSPHETFREVQDALLHHRLWTDVRVAYRPVNEEEYTVLWPEDYASFNVQ